MEEKVRDGIGDGECGITGKVKGVGMGKERKGEKINSWDGDKNK